MDSAKIDLKRFKQQVSEFVEVLKGKQIGLVDGLLSREDRLYNAEARHDDLEIFAIQQSFERLGLSFKIIDPTKKGWLSTLLECDPIFINIHGEYGEDGRLQGLLEMLGKTYIGSSLTTNAIGICKPVFKGLLSSLGYNTPEFNWMPWGQTPLCKSSVELLRFPVMAKPINGGCSMGIVKLNNLQDYFSFRESDRSIDADYFFEEYKTGVFVTVSIITIDGVHHALPVLQVESSNEFYDETAKKDPDSLGLTKYSFPDVEMREVQTIALELSRYVGLVGFGRFDFIVDEDNRPWLLEINTIPGVSYAGNLPFSCYEAGISYDDLIVNIFKESYVNNRIFNSYMDKSLFSDEPL